MLGSTGADPAVTTFFTNPLFHPTPSDTFSIPRALACVTTDTDIALCQEENLASTCTSATEAAAVKCLPTPGSVLIFFNFFVICD
jgi:hypothetical protein